MKTIVLLGVLVLLLLFLNWRNPTEHMTLVNGVPVVEQADVNALLALWRADPIVVKKQTDDKATIDKALNCTSGRARDSGRDFNDRINNARQYKSLKDFNGSAEDMVKMAQDINSKNNC